MKVLVIGGGSIGIAMALVSRLGCEAVALDLGLATAVPVGPEPLPPAPRAVDVIIGSVNGIEAPVFRLESGRRRAQWKEEVGRHRRR